jgi:hypothetical protein
LSYGVVLTISYPVICGDETHVQRYKSSKTQVIGGEIYMDKLSINKKYLLVPLSLVLVATMLITPFANAGTTSYVINIESSYGVTNPGNAIGSKTDGAYANFDGLDSKMIVKAVTVPAGGAVKIQAKAFTGTPNVKCYSGPTATGPWTQIGYGTNIGGEGPYKVGTAIGGHQYFAISNSGGALYVDLIYFEY